MSILTGFCSDSISEGLLISNYQKLSGGYFYS